ncbi:MAG: protein-disulfide reductase DsbD [Granulosicoccus sp.]
MHKDLPKLQRKRWAAALLISALLALVLLSIRAPALGNLLKGNPEPLPPEVAFVPSLGKASGEALTVNFDIEEGYYLYRDKTSFKVESVESVSALSSIVSDAAVNLGKPKFPEAQILTDDYFGEMSIYRKSVSIEIPYSTLSPVKSGILAVKYQGCADIGLCYPPTTVSIPFELPVSAKSSIAATVSASLGLTQPSAPLPSSLASPFEGNSADANIFGTSSVQDDLLPPELAYLPQISSANYQNIGVRWYIEPGYYLYRHKLSFELENLPGAVIGAVNLDPGVDQHDEFFGKVKVFRDIANARLDIKGVGADTLTTDSNLIISYQGCADIGVCFPPSKVSLPLSLDADSPDAPVVAANVSSAIINGDESKQLIADNTTGAAAPEGQSEQDRLFTMLGNNSLWLTVATFFGFGILLAFTPCVLPMVPILSSLIVGQGDKMSTFRAFQLSLIYVLVMATTYAIVGVIVGLSGYNVQAFLQNPWVLSGIAALFVVLSLSMFGFYELQMPVRLQEKLTKWSNKQGGGQASGVAAMGFISTLIVGPCITAPLAGALIYIAKTGDAVIGGAALFALGLGMGAPLLLIGTSAGKFVPKAGAWMNAVKYVFGITMLGMAVYMISRFIPSTVTMALYGVLALFSGIYFGATDTLTRDSSGWQRFGKALGLVVLLYGVALLIGALSGNGSYTTPLRGIASNNTSNTNSEEHGLAFAPVKSVSELNQIVAQASRENRPVMLDFYADWCISCKEMEAFTFTDSTVQDLLRNAVVIQADVTANDDLDQEMLKHFDLFGPPGIIFYDTEGYEIRSARVVGFMSAEKFSSHLQRHLGGARI